MRLVLVRLLHVDGCGGCGGAAMGAGVGGGVALDDGHGTAQAVKPLLLVKDVVDLKCVRLTLHRVLETHTEDVLGCKRTENSVKMNKFISVFNKFISRFLSAPKTALIRKRRQSSPLSELLKAPLNEPPMRTSPSCRSSSTRSCTGMG